MEYFNIHNENLDQNKRESSLTKKDRDAFKNEFEAINQLIEDTLEEHSGSSSITQNPSAYSSNADKSTPNKAEKSEDTLAIKQSYNAPEKLYRERMQRIGILKNDPTGQQLKAAGEDQ